MRFSIVVAGLLAVLALTGSGLARADTTPTVNMGTPDGFKPVGLSTVLPAQVGYEACPLGGCDSTGTIVLSDQVSVTTDQDIPCGGQFTINFVLVGNAGGSLGTASITNGDGTDPSCQPIPAGTTQVVDVVPPRHHAGFAGDYSNAQMAEMANGVDLVTNEPDGSSADLGMVTVASYAPVAAVVGDPWFRFTSVFKADSRLVIENRRGKTVRKINLGWLKRGHHSIKFRCRKLNGSFMVHVHGVAKDGAKQSSPARRVRC